MRFDLPREKVVSCRITNEMNHLLKKHNIDLYDIIVWFLDSKGDMFNYELMCYKKLLSDCKVDQIVYEEKIKELEKQASRENDG